MKNFTISLATLLATALTATAQDVNYFSLSLGSDIKSSTVGSKATDYKASPDIIIGAHMVGSNFELNPEIESFAKIGYFRFGLNAGYHSERYVRLFGEDHNFTIVPSIGFSMIHRYGFEDREIYDPKIKTTTYIYGSSSHFAVQANLSFRFKLTDGLLLDFNTGLQTRPDLMYRYPTDSPKNICLNNTLKLHFIIN